MVAIADWVSSFPWLLERCQEGYLEGSLIEICMPSEFKIRTLVFSPDFT